VTPNATRPPEPPARTLRLGHLDLDVARVDAAVAQEWLSHNVCNRMKRRSRLAEFKRDMLNNNWRTVGDPIRFDTNGDMCDGQHRMIALGNAALIDPGIEFDFLVIRGIKTADRHVLDTGTRRSAADQLRINGYKNYSTLASAAKWCAMWDRDALYAADFSTRSITHAEILGYVIENPDLEAVVNRVVSRLRLYIDIPPGYIAAAYYLCQRINAKQADEFFERTADGVGLPGRDPILALRRRLHELDKAHAVLRGEQWLGLLARTWNARREGRSMRTLAVYREDIPIACPSLK
jgi:hypothetical protein